MEALSREGRGEGRGGGRIRLTGQQNLTLPVNVAVNVVLALLTSL